MNGGQVSATNDFILGSAGANNRYSQTGGTGMMEISDFFRLETHDAGADSIRGNEIGGSDRKAQMHRFSFRRPPAFHGGETVQNGEMHWI